MNLSYALEKASSLDEVVKLINNGSCEGMDTEGGTEFSSEQLAGQYVYECAVRAGFGCDIETLQAHFEIIAEHGAMFDAEKALAHAQLIHSRSQIHLMNPHTGSVDTVVNWKLKMDGWEASNGQTQQEQYNSLVQVEKSESGEWIKI